MIGTRGSGRRSTDSHAAIMETLRADFAKAEGPQIEEAQKRASKAFSERKGAKAEPEKVVPAKTPKPAKRKRGSK